MSWCVLRLINDNGDNDDDYGIEYRPTIGTRRTTRAPVFASGFRGSADDRSQPAVAAGRRRRAVADDAACLARLGVVVVVQSAVAAATSPHHQHHHHATEQRKR